MKKPKLSASRALIDDLVAASRILAQHEVLDAYGHVSARSDKRPSVSSCRARWRPRWSPPPT